MEYNNNNYYYKKNKNMRIHTNSDMGKPQPIQFFIFLHFFYKLQRVQFARGGIEVGANRTDIFGMSTRQENISLFSDRHEYQVTFTLQAHG